ncbi:hypothetical protein EW146_g3934 [Bondarzewia mesenterica]|uniref:Ferroxidase n=1 Tax=Bondarzewia mesenterica TaxID=1095465 RepID=A0A4V3XFB3_9AGAM|nr:hypothetical protein EW146_g3934 [Bondarzewia mesenterica]
MLKRQRPVTPPPSIPIVALDPSPFDRSVKRRRVLPPSLDGPSRGWGAPPHSQEQDSDGEEYVDEDGAMGTRTLVKDASHDIGAVNSGAEAYKSVNTLLHDLHAEHQYRRVLASTSNMTSFVADDRIPLHSSYATPMSNFGKHVVTPLYGHGLSADKDPHYFGEAPPHADYIVTLEGERVKHRYEDTNKYVAVGHAVPQSTTRAARLLPKRTLAQARTFYAFHHHDRHVPSMTFAHQRHFATPPPRTNISDLSVDRYHALSDATMDTMLDSLESLLDDFSDPSYEVEYNSGVLTLKLGEHGTYVVNKQPPNKQIWLSSPLRCVLMRHHNNENEIVSCYLPPLQVDRSDMIIRQQKMTGFILATGDR